ncbi:MAG: glycine dehydrogenase subunit 2 [Francisellaceae bacterium]|jgi:glycine dehydrogenase subunit 2
MLIFDKFKQNKSSHALMFKPKGLDRRFDSKFSRKEKSCLPSVSELEVVRHFTYLSHKNFSIDTNFYPLGSCTMKYNPKICFEIAAFDEFASMHPLTSEKNMQGILHCLHQLQEYIKHITGMTAVSLSPMAGSQGEFAGVAMIRAYHDARGDTARNEIIVPDAAHGTNPATAAMCGYKVKEVRTRRKNGDVDLDALKAALGPQTAGIMLTNPSTLGVFERNISEIAEMVHEVGGLLYYDGANLNAIMGKVRPGEMGFDVMHLNLHKTFATPHGGGGPGAGPIAVNDRLKEFLPVPTIKCSGQGYHWVDETERPATIGRLSAFGGNTGILLRAYIYMKLLGADGLEKASEMATLNANYLLKGLQAEGFTIEFPDRRATHEFIVTLEPEHKEYGVTAADFSKALLDYDIHAPTMYFPLIVPECLLIEPTETESKAQLDNFITTMSEIRKKAQEDSSYLKGAPYRTLIARADEVKAVKEINVKADL